MSISTTPTLDELTRRIDRIRSLLHDPQPGLWSWRTGLANSMRDLCDWWDGGEGAIQLPDASVDNPHLEIGSVSCNRIADGAICPPSLADIKRELNDWIAQCVHNWTNLYIQNSPKYGPDEVIGTRGPRR